MKKCLIMLTNEYPFEKSETFIEAEIEHHPDNFDKVILLSLDLPKDAKQTRNTPQGVDVYNVTKTNKKLGRIADLIFGLFGSHGHPEFYKSDKEEIRYNPFKFVFHKYFTQRALRIYKYCSKELEKYDFSEYDKVVIYSYWLSVSGIVSVLLKEKISAVCSDVKAVSRGHGYDVYGRIDEFRKLPINGYLPLRKYLFQNLDKVYPCSKDGEKFLISKFPDFADKIKHFYLGSLDHGIVKTQKVKNSLNIVSCSRIDVNKRVEKIIEALCILDNSGLNITWTHIGDGINFSKCEALAENLPKNIKYSFTGQISNEAVYDKFLNNSYDLMLNVSESEGVPVSLMEAISFGTPVVATNVGGIPEIIQNNYNGRLIEKDFSSRKLAEKIKEFAFMDTHQIEFFRENARSKWINEFDSRKNYAEFSKVLSEL